MDPNPVRDIYAKAKIEEPNLNLRFPKNLFLKPAGDPLQNLCYIKLFGFLERFANFSQDFCCYNTRKSQHLAEADCSGEKLDRKVYRIRNRELVTGFGDNFEGMNDIHSVSKATIGILADSESNLLRHSFLDLLGSVEEVRAAEELILIEVLKTYGSLTFPVILMPPIIYGDHINIPLHKVNRVLGDYRTNLLRMEMESGAWIKIEPGHSSLGSEWRVVNVFGPQENINKAKSLIESVISENEEVADTAEGIYELQQQIEEPSCVELVDGKKYADGDSEKKEKMQKLKGKQQLAEEGGSSVAEEENQEEHVQDKDEDEKEGDESKDQRHGQEMEDVDPLLASGCYGLELYCVSHA